MIRQREAVLVDSGAWIALALSRDPLHERAREQWDLLCAAGASSVTLRRLLTSNALLDNEANYWTSAVDAPVRGSSER